MKSKEIDWVNVLWLFGTPLATLLLLPLEIHWHGFQWPVFLLFFFGVGVGNMGITGGYHRLISHRSYQTPEWVKFAYLMIAAANFQGSALQWASDHRRHHRMIDTDDDPYSIKKGFFYAHMGWLFHKDEPRHRGKYPLDLLNDRLIMWQHKYYVPIAIFMCFIVPMLIGAAMGNAFGGLVWGGLLRVVVAQHATFFINSACHYIGRQPYYLKNSARDSFIMAVFAFGEGYHNYHHRFQTDYRNGIRWYHWDPTKWLVAVLSWVGAASNLKRIPDSMIMEARLQTAMAGMGSRGEVTERLASLKLRVEEAQKRFRVLRDDYRALKKSFGDQSRMKLIHMKGEVRVAKLEFKMAWAQWAAYLRTVRAIPAYH